MKDETRLWVAYAQDDLESAKLLVKSKLYNPCMQNSQQAVEKMLKALLIERSIKFRKTHSINELAALLEEHDMEVGLAEEDRDLLDSIYIPSKYPFGSAIPDFEPDARTAQRCLEIADRVTTSGLVLLK